MNRRVATPVAIATCLVFSVALWLSTRRTPNGSHEGSATESTPSHPSSAGAGPSTGESQQATTPAPAAVRPVRIQPELVTGPDRGRSPLADRLNAPDGTIDEDMAVLRRVLQNYLLEFGVNPVGSNREITAQLTGRNPRRHAPLPSDLTAISREGELLDRWATPYFFHALSAREMEIRSAGPDRDLYTEDDAVWSPKAR